MLLFNVPPNGNVDDILPRAMEYPMKGLIIMSVAISSEMANECARQGMAVVLFSRYTHESNVSAVCCDNVAGGKLVADYLLDTGDKQLAFIAGNENTSSNIDRELGFGNRLRECGMPQYLREQGDFSYPSGYEAAIRLLKRDAPPEAIFCANDNMAMGCMDAARHELGISIPEELVVIGFDDIPASSWPSYGLTTIRQPVNRMIDATLALLEKRVGTPDIPPVLHLEPGRLIERTSTRRRDVQNARMLG